MEKATDVRVFSRRRSQPSAQPSVLQAQVQLQSRIDAVRRFACDQALVTDAGASSGQRTRMRQGLRW
jgi:hypothetical protein